MALRAGFAQVDITPEPGVEMNDLIAEANDALERLDAYLKNA